MVRLLIVQNCTKVLIVQDGFTWSVTVYSDSVVQNLEVYQPGRISDSVVQNLEVYQPGRISDSVVQNLEVYQPGRFSDSVVQYLEVYQPGRITDAFILLLQHSICSSHCTYLFEISTA